MGGHINSVIVEMLYLFTFTTKWSLNFKLKYCLLQQKLSIHCFTEVTQLPLSFKSSQFYAYSQYHRLWRGFTMCTAYSTRYPWTSDSCKEKCPQKKTVGERERRGEAESPGGWRSGSKASGMRHWQPEEREWKSHRCKAWSDQTVTTHWKLRRK